MNYRIRAALPPDGQAMLKLMPRLASFPVPKIRTPEHLWRDDAALLRKWIDGAADQCLVHVAEGENGEILGLTLVSLRPELLSHEASAHLEAIAVSEAAEGKGIGHALLAAAESAAVHRGARSMTLHVFAVNRRARRLYEKAGYDGELIRYIKRFGNPLEVGDDWDA